MNVPVQLAEVVVVYRQSQRAQMSQFLGSVYPNAYGHVRIDQCVVEDDVGTADALRHIKDKIKVPNVARRSGLALLISRRLARRPAERLYCCLV